jgi:hypothetical protein
MRGLGSYGASRTLVRGRSGLSPAARRATRIVAGLPEGYFEAFVTLCRDYADIQSKLAFISDARSTMIPTVLRLCAF